MASRYLICTSPRSGSNNLCLALKSTNLLGSPEEYFNREKISARYRGAGASPGSLTEFIETNLTPPAAERGGIISSKLFWFELEDLRASFGLYGDQADVIEAIDKPFDGVVFVYLVRKDKLRQAISYVLAYKTGVWWTLRGEESRVNVEPPVTFQEIHYWIAKMEYWEQCWYGLLNNYASKTLTVYYEDLTHDPEGTVNKVAAHVGRELKQIEIGSITTPLLRQSDGRTKSLVSRYRGWVLGKREPC